MKNNITSNNLGGIVMAVNEKVEVISHSNEDLYGKIGVIKEMKEWDLGTELKLTLADGYETWIDSEDVLLQNI